MKTTLLVGVSALAFILATPGAALADSECGTPDTSSNPNVVSCVSNSGQYVNGITYDQSSYGTPAGLRLDLYGTIVVAPTASTTAVQVTGSLNQAAIITARAGGRFTASGTGLSATASGTGAATVDSHGTVNAGTIGLVAQADLTGGTGLGSVLNESDGKVTLTQTGVTSSSYGLFARGGSASAINNGTLTATSATSGTGTIYGIAGESHATAGTLTLQNTGTVTLQGAPNMVGMASTYSTGAVSIANSGSLSVTSQAGDATGMAVVYSGTAGAVGITNNGVLAVSASGSAIGMDVNQGTSVSLVAQRTGATGSMSVSGAEATGFQVSGASGAVSVQNSGFVQRVTGGDDGATGVWISGGTTQNVRFSDAVIGGTTYQGDLTVSSSEVSAGVLASGASGDVAVNFTGANLSVIGAGSVVGIATSDGADVTISTAANASTGNGAAIAVNTSAGDAWGIAVLQASGSESVALGDSFSVTSTGGAATGLWLLDGSAQTVSLARGATISGIGATGATLSGSTGAISFSSAAALSVDGGTGGANGLTVSDGTSQTIDTAGAVTVRANGSAASGIATSGASGDVQLTVRDSLSVHNQDGSAAGIAIGAGANETVSLAQGIDVQASGSASGASLTGTGALSLQSANDFAVAAGTGVATGLSMAGGTSQSASFGGNLLVSTADAATGVSQSGASGAVSTVVSGALSVSAGASGGTGITMAGGTSQSVQVDGAFSVAAADGTTIGVLQSGASGAVSASFLGGFTVSGGTTGATGIDVSGGTTQSVQLTAGASISGSGGTVLGVRQAGGTGAIETVVGGAFTVTGGTGGATGIEVADGTSQAVQLGGALSVSAAGGTALGVQLQGGQSSTLAATGDFTVSNSAGAATGIYASGPATTVQLAKGATISSVGGMAVGVQATGGATISTTGAISVTSDSDEARGISFNGATAATTIHLPTTLTVASTTYDAFGILGRTGAGLTLDGAGTIDVRAGGNAVGIYALDQTGAQSVTIGTVSVESSGAQAGGIALTGSAGIQLTAGTVTVRAASGGGGVQLVGTGATGDVQATLGTVEFAGDNSTGVMLAQSGGANVLAAIDSVTVSGESTSGVVASAQGNGTVALTIGRASATVTALAASSAVAVNGVSTSGANGTGVSVAVVDGAGSVINNGTVATTGADAIGIAATATGTGSLAVTSATVTTSGSAAHGIALTSGSGAQTIAAQSVTVAGAGAQAISASSTGGAITVQSGTLVAQQGASYAIGASSGLGAITVSATNSSAASADAIHLASTGGDISVTLADGGVTRSGTGAGLFVDTDGYATINLGASATTATVQGATAGISSRAADGQTVTLSGVIGADNGLAVSLAGGAAALVNRGVINGRVAVTSSSLAFTNAGTWNLTGAQSFGGNAVLTNSGTINIAASATAATTTQFVGLSSLRNSGTISLSNGQVGDVLDLGGASFVGSSGSRVVLDANLSGTAVNGVAAQTSDLLRVGAASGTTTLVIHDVSGAGAGQFNFTGIQVVSAASATAGAFVLDGGSINKGFAEYQLLADASGNLNLVSLPTAQAFALVRTGAEARRYWRRSADAWAEQMRGSAPGTGLSVWGQLHGGEETNRSRPVYTETVLGTPTRFTPNLDVRDSWAGGQLGLDWGQGNWSVGATAGYLSQQGRLTATGDRIKLNGGNLGIYIRYRSADGFFAHLLGKADRYTVKYQLTGGAAAPDVDGTSYGFQAEAGYHVRAGALFFEPAASIAVSHGDVDGIENAAGGLNAAFDKIDGAYGRAGLRAGVETRSGSWTVKPYLGAAWEGELSGRPGVTLGSGTASLRLEDTNEAGRARIEAGVEGGSSRGLAVFGKVEAVTGAKAKGVGGRAGVALRW